MRYPELYAARGITPGLPLPNGEPDAEGLARFQQALKTAAALAPGDFAVVSHGGILRLYLNTLSQSFPKPGYGQIIALTWDGETFHLQED